MRFSFVCKSLVVQLPGYQTTCPNVTLHQTTKFYTCPNWKAFADDNLNVIQKSKFALGPVKSIMGKGENAGYQHFLLFQQCFQKASYIGSLKVRIEWKRVKFYTTQSWLLTTLKKEPFESFVRKEENAGNQHFLLFSQCFLLYQEQILPFESPLICRLQTLSIWTCLKFCRW